MGMGTISSVLDITNQLCKKLNVIQLLATASTSKALLFLIVITATTLAYLQQLFPMAVAIVVFSLAFTPLQTLAYHYCVLWQPVGSFFTITLLHVVQSFLPLACGQVDTTLATFIICPNLCLILLLNQLITNFQWERGSRVFINSPHES